MVCGLKNIFKFPCKVITFFGVKVNIATIRVQIRIIHVIHTTTATLRPKSTPQKKQHPTQKPLEVLKHLLAVVPKDEGQEPPVVLDCFCGSGSTGVACAELGLDFIGVELSKEYAALASMNLEAALLSAQENKEKDSKEEETIHVYF